MKSPEEIALAILAEIKAVINGRAGGMCRDRKKPLHEHNEREGLRPCSTSARSEAGRGEDDTAITDGFANRTEVWQRFEIC